MVYTKEKERKRREYVENRWPEKSAAEEGQGEGRALALVVSISPPPPGLVRN